MGIASKELGTRGGGVHSPQRQRFAVHRSSPDDHCGWRSWGSRPLWPTRTSDCTSSGVGEAASELGSVCHAHTDLLSPRHTSTITHPPTHNRWRHTNSRIQGHQTQTRRVYKHKPLAHRHFPCRKPGSARVFITERERERGAFFLWTGSIQ